MSRGITAEGIDAVDAFLRAGKHLTPEGQSVKLKVFRGAFAGRHFSAKRVLDAYHPEIAEAMRTASLADSCLGKSAAAAVTVRTLAQDPKSAKATLAEGISPEGVQAVERFLRAGKHLTPASGVIT